MTDSEKLLYITYTEYFQLRDRMMRSGLDSAMILTVIDGMRARATEEVMMETLSSLADIERGTEAESGGDDS